MNQPLSGPYYHVCCDNDQREGLWRAVPVLFWQEPTGSPQWLWFILASSPIVVLIVLLVVAILILLVVVWLRGRRRPQIEPDPTLSSASRLEADPPAETLTGPPPSSAIDTPPSPTDELVQTKPTPAVRVPEAETVDIVSSAVQTEPDSGPRPANIGWQIAGLTDMGLKRELNEDSLLMMEAAMADTTPYGLYVVADGLGGHQGGEVASQLTVGAIKTHFTSQPPPPAAFPFDDWLIAAAMSANEAVLDHHADQNQAKKMGSTVVMALILNQTVHIANVGDSRAYHLNQVEIRQVSVDHSLVERLVQIGQLSREEARTHKNRNVLYNSIGDKPEMEVNTYHIELKSGDRLLLCSDGLSGMITDEEIFNLSRSQPDPARACQSMIEAAKSAGGTDNITAIIVQMN